MPIPTPEFDDHDAHIVEVSSPTVPTVKRHAVETQALLESERRLAATNRSGVRPVAPEISALDTVAMETSNAVTKVHRVVQLDVLDTAAMDMSNAVTKVHRAVQLDAFAPPTVEVAIVASPMITVVQPASEPANVASVEPVFQPLAPPQAEEETRSAGLGTSPQSAGDVDDEPARPRSRGRRILAGLLVVIVMAGATALLVSAVRQGRLQLPASLLREAAPLLRVLR
jgi:hypothetical protein